MYVCMYVCMHVCMYVCRVKAGGSPELSGTLSLVMYYKRRYGKYRDGGVGGGGV